MDLLPVDITRIVLGLVELKNVARSVWVCRSDFLLSAQIFLSSKNTLGDFSRIFSSNFPSRRAERCRTFGISPWGLHVLFLPSWPFQNSGTPFCHSFYMIFVCLNGPDQLASWFLLGSLRSFSHVAGVLLPRNLKVTTFPSLHYTFSSDRFRLWSKPISKLYFSHSEIPIRRITRVNLPPLQFNWIPNQNFPEIYRRPLSLTNNFCLGWPWHPRNGHRKSGQCNLQWDLIAQIIYGPSVPPLNPPSFSRPAPKLLGPNICEWVRHRQVPMVKERYLALPPSWLLL